MRKCKNDEDFEEQEKEEENSAVKSLHLISMGETNFIQDWASLSKKEKEQCKKNEEIKLWKMELGEKIDQRPNSSLRKDENKYVKRKSMICFKRGKIVNGTTKKVFKIETENYATLSPKKLSFKKEEQERYNENLEPLEVEKQKSTKRSNSLVTVSYDEDKILKLLKIEASNNRNNMLYPTSVSYLEKIRNQSHIWLKNTQKRNLDFSNLNPEIQIQEPSKISELIKNRIKRKQSEKLSPKKQIIEVKSIMEKEEMNICVFEPIRTEKNDKCENVKEERELKILKNWLDSNRFKKKRSVTSLLREHFENRYADVREDREKKIGKSFKKISFSISETHV